MAFSNSTQKKDARRSKIAKIPGVSALAALFARVARIQHGRTPTGLLMLLPVALFIDLVDSPLDLLGGPFSMAIAFFLEAAFMLGLTGKTSWALLFSGIDLIPGVDLIPFATITLVKEIARAFRQGGYRTPVTFDGPVIDV